MTASEGEEALDFKRFQNGCISVLLMDESDACDTSVCLFSADDKHEELKHAITFLHASLLFGYPMPYGLRISVDVSCMCIQKYMEI